MEIPFLPNLQMDHNCWPRIGSLRSPESLSAFKRFQAIRVFSIVPSNLETSRSIPMLFGLCLNVYRLLKLFIERWMAMFGGENKKPQTNHCSQRYN